MEKAIRVVHIDSDTKPGNRIRLELRFNKSHERQWFDTTNNKWIGHTFKDSREALRTVQSWYPNPIWNLRHGSNDPLYVRDAQAKTRLSGNPNDADLSKATTDELIGKLEQLVRELKRRQVQ